MRYICRVKKNIIFLLCLSFVIGQQCSDTSFQAGQRLYKANCANCHMDHGEGLGALIPPLAKSDYLAAHRNELPCLLRRGLGDSITVNGKIYAEKMAGLPHLSEVDIVNILNYINHAWGNDNGIFRLDEVEKCLEACPK